MANLQTMNKRMDTDDDTSAALLADHPLLEKFQIALREHLCKINAQLEKEMADIDHNVNELNKQREEIGSNLYDLQQEIERQKDSIDSFNTRISETFEKRIKCEDENRQSKNELKTLQENYNETKRAYNQRTAELNKLQMLEKNIEKWQKDMRNDVEVSKRMISKDKQDKQRITEEKKQMDLLLLNLEMEVRRREAQSGHILEQIHEQEKVLESLNATFAAANADLDALQGEHHRLVSSWNAVIHAIANRDKLLARTNATLTEENEKIKVIQTNIEGTKKETLRQMEQNENLEQSKQRLTDDLNRLSKQYDKVVREHSALMAKMDELSVLVQVTDASISKSMTENYILQGNLKNIRSEHERQINNKTKLEEDILNVLQDQVTTDQASKSRARDVRDIQNKRREMELMMSTAEGKLSEILFELEKLKGIVTRSKSHVDDLTKDKIVVEQKSEQYEHDLKAIKKAIESKLKTFDCLNKRLAQLIETADGTEKDPLELKIYDLERTIAELETEIRDDQNQWLRYQNNIVNLSEKRNQQLNDMHLARKQLMIIEQKTLKIDNELEGIEKQDQNLVRDIKNMNTKLDLLSAKIFEKKQNNEMEKKQCQFTHMNMIDKLKSDEMSVVQLEDELRTITIEIDELKHNVMDKYREALSWETKWKMVTEAKRQLDAEYAKVSEIGTMKSEIHRMEVRYNQLKRAQEKLVHDMENCVQHRDHIFEGANIRSKLTHIKSKMINTMQHRVNELKTKLKQVTVETNAIEKQIAGALTEKECAERELAKINQMIDDERAQYILLQNEIEQAVLLKQENLNNIVHLQQRAKLYRSITLAKQLPKSRNEATVDNNMDRHVEINEHLIGVLEGLLLEFRDQKFNIKRVLLTLKPTQ